MKIFTLASLMAIASFTFFSCSKQTNTNISDSQTGGNINPLSKFDWEGTAPLSAKVDGRAFLATSVTVHEFFGYYYITGDANDGSSISPGIPVSATEGQVYSFPSPANLNWQNSSSSMEENIVLGAGKGQCKIITNNATVIEGYFWADMKDYTNVRDTTVRITQGYFKVDKPQ